MVRFLDYGTVPGFMEVFMSDRPDPIAEAARKGLKEILNFGSRVGDSLRVASNNAIEKLDVIQLERKRDALYRELGEIEYLSVLSPDPDDAALLRKKSIVDSVYELNAAIDERLSSTRNSGKDPDSGEA